MRWRETIEIVIARMSEVLVIVPARAGSKSVRRKNLQLLDGQPLFLHACETGARLGKVIVSTNDDTVAAVARIHGYQVAWRTEHVDDDATMMSVIASVCSGLGHDGPGVLIQPTVPFVTAGTLRTMLDTAIATGQTVVGGTQSKHLVWADGVRPLRVNRQNIETLQEVGAYAWPSIEGLDQPNIILGVPAGEELDIDTIADLHSARLHANRKRILFRFVAGDKTGSGHAHRVATLANALQHHDVRYEADVPDWAHDLMDVPQSTHDDYHLVVNDTLGTSTRFGTVGTVNFEDHRKGNVADATINALYGSGPYSGSDWAVLRSEFMGLPPFQAKQAGPYRVLLLFGGTDPSRLTERCQKLLHGLDVTAVADYMSVAEAMRDADLLVTSAGRTVFEAAAVGVPSIVLAQNNREATHTHLGPAHGNVFLGLGKLVSDDQIVGAVRNLLDHADLRAELSSTARASIDGRGVERIVRLVDGILTGLLH